MSWSFGKKRNDEPEWPKDDNDVADAPAYLTHIGGGPLDMELTLNLLKAYGIPHVCEFPNNGLFGKLIMGHPPSGMEVFVPESMLEDAQNLINTDMSEYEDDEFEENRE